MNLLPCSYLLYYFKQKEMLAIEMGEYYKGGARAQVVQKVEKQLFELYKNPELKVKPKELEQRGGAYYSDEMCIRDSATPVRPIRLLQCIEFA